MAGYAEYGNSDNYAEGLDDSLEDFYADVAKAYQDCKKSGAAGEGDDSYDPYETIKTLSQDLANAIHKFMLSAKIDTDVTYPGPTFEAIPPADQVMDATIEAGPDGVLNTDMSGFDPADPTTLPDVEGDDEPAKTYGTTKTMNAIGGQLAAGTDPGPIDEQTGTGKGHLE